MAVTGRIQIRSYDHKDGYKVYITEVQAEEVKFLEFSGKKEKSDFSPIDPIDTGDIPF